MNMFHMLLPFSDWGYVGDEARRSVAKYKKQKQNLEHMDIKHIWQYETNKTDTAKYDIKRKKNVANNI